MEWSGELGRYNIVRGRSLDLTSSPECLPDGFALCASSCHSLASSFSGFFPPPAARPPPTAGLSALPPQPFSSPALATSWLSSQWPAEKFPELENQANPQQQMFITFLRTKGSWEMTVFGRALKQVASFCCFSSSSSWCF